MIESFIQNAATAPNQAIPKPGAISVVDGQFTKEVWRYFASLSQPPYSESALTIAASPTFFTAPGNGSLLVSGGSGLTLAIVSRRNRGGAANAPSPANYPVGAGFIPMSQGDTLTITYTAAPECIWFPK